jgi:uncharacterized OB-fold protein
MNPKKKPVYIECEGCGNVFLRKRAWQKYCGAKCRWETWDLNNPRTKKQGAVNA